MSVDALPSPTYEGGSVYLNGFSDGPKPYAEVLTFLRKGTELLKYGRIGAPKSHPFRLSNDMTELQWESKKGQVRRIHLSYIDHLTKGQKTPLFRKYPQPDASEVSFSIHYKDDAKRPRTLDVICRTKQEFDMWFWGLQVILHYPPTKFYAMQQQQHLLQGPLVRAPTYPSSVSSSVSTQAQNPVPLTFRMAPVADANWPKATPKPKPAAGMDLIKGMRGSGTGPFSSHADSRAQMGDLYAWGSFLLLDTDEPTASSAFSTTGSHESLRALMHSKGPTLVGDAISVDVAWVACAPRHAALITRNGELYTWGAGRDGNLGHGWCGNMPKPRLLTRMVGRGVRTVSCGEGATGAISADQRLFMWGKNLTGQLGNGYCFPCAEPAPVFFPGLRADVKVSVVSCGTYHTAAIVDGGLLYTWGHGLFGRLGHGSHSSEYRPRLVADLEDKLVVDVACGYWHTAAVAIPRSTVRSRAPSLTPSMDFGTPNSTPGGATPLEHCSLPNAASAPNISAPGEDNGLGSEVTLRVRSRTADMSSSECDLQAAVAAATGIAMTATRGRPSGGISGGDLLGAHAVVSACVGGGVGGGLRDDELNCSLTSLEKLPDTLSEELPQTGSVGMMFTWGADFMWAEGDKRDKHHGCLGLGDDVEGRLVPTRVHGDMDKHGVVQVACGWSMTIGLSADGRVYQMGTTGAHTKDQNCTWEGAKVPTRVDGNLFGMFVEEVACGMRHVVVVASKVQANGQIPDDQRRVRLLAWGCGAEGQLGVLSSSDSAMSFKSTPVDYALPQIIRPLDGRRVLHVAAGGNMTMAVVEHDPRTRRSNPAPSVASMPATSFSSICTTPSGGGTQSRVMSVASYQSVVGAVTTGVRDAASAAGTFQLSQSLPLTVAAAGLQSLHQMVAGSVGARSKGGTPTTAAEFAYMARNRQGRVIGLPQFTVAAQWRSDLHHPSHRHRSDMRRSATRVLAEHHALLENQALQQGLPMGAQDGKGMDIIGMASQRSSLPSGQQSEDAESSPNSTTNTNTLYQMSSAGAEFQSARTLRTSALETRKRSSSVDSGAVTGALMAAAAAADFNRPLLHQQQRASTGNIMETQSIGDNSIGEMPETDTDSYAYGGGRSLDMVPEQSEESPASPSTSHPGCRVMATPHARPHPQARHSLASSTPGGVGGSGSGSPLMFDMGVHDFSSAARQVTSPTQSRLGRLAPQALGGGPAAADVANGTLGEGLRSSLSTMASSHTAGGSASSVLSPSGILSASPETPSAEPVRSSLTGMPPTGMQLPYTIHEELPPISPPLPQQQQLSFVSLHPATAAPSSQRPQPQPQLQQPLTPHSSSMQASGPPSRHGSMGQVVSPQTSISRTQSGTVPAPMAAGGSGAGLPTPGASSRSREMGISAWPQLQAQPGSGTGMFRPEGSMHRMAFSMQPDAAAAATTTGLPVGVGHGGAVSLMGATLRSTGSRSSRGHSRHASYDSADLNSREVEGVATNQRSSAITMGSGGNGGSTYDTRGATMYVSAQALAPVDVVAVMQQNERLKLELETMRQQMALLAQAAGLGQNAASASAAGGQSFSSPYMAMPSSLPLHQQQLQHLSPVAAAKAAVPSSPKSIAANGSGAVNLHPHSSGSGSSAAAAALAHFSDPSVCQGAGSGGGLPSAFAAQAMAMVMASQMTPPLQQQQQQHLLQHTHSTGVGSLPLAGASSISHSGFNAGRVIAWGPVPGSGSQLDRQASVPAALQPPAPQHLPSRRLPHQQPTAAANRHKRSVSIDIALLMATRDGTGPSKDYPSPAAPSPPGISHPPLPPPPQQQRPLHRPVDRVPSLTRDGSSFGHLTAPAALETLRQAHPGATLAQAALSNLVEEEDDDEEVPDDAGYEEEEDDDDNDDDQGDDEREDGEEEGGMEPAVDESVGSVAGLGRIGSVTLSVPLQLAAQGSLNRQMYVLQQQQQQQQRPSLSSLQRQQSGPTERFPSAPVQAAEPSLGSVCAHTKETIGHPISDSSLRSCCSDDSSGSSNGQAREGVALPLWTLLDVTEGQQTYVPAAAPAAKGSEQSSSGGNGRGAKSIWRGRSNAFVEWAKTMQVEMSGGGPEGGKEASTNSGVDASTSAAVGSSSTGVAGSATPSGPSVAWAPHTETLSPEGTQFQYAPGVYVTIKPPLHEGERIRLVKIRFNRRMFTDAEATAWWNEHSATLGETYNVTFEQLRKAPLPTPCLRPPLPPGAHAATQPAGAAAAATAAIHTRVLSTDMQGTSGGGTAIPGNNFFSLAALSGSGALHGLSGAGSSGSAVSSGHVAAAATAMGLGLGTPSGTEARTSWPSGLGDDYRPNWTDVNYEDPSALQLPPPLPPVCLPPGAAAPPRHSRSRSSSRTASGSSIHTGLALMRHTQLSHAQCPDSPVPVLRQSVSAGYTAVAFAATAAAGAPHQPNNRQTRSSSEPTVPQT